MPVTGTVDAVSSVGKELQLGTAAALLEEELRTSPKDSLVLLLCGATLLLTCVLQVFAMLFRANKVRNHAAATPLQHLQCILP